MTSLLLFIVIVLVVLALVYWAITLIPFPAGPIKVICLVLAILFAAFLIAQRAGLLHG